MGEIDQVKTLIKNKAKLLSLSPPQPPIINQPEWLVHNRLFLGSLIKIDFFSSQDTIITCYINVPLTPPEQMIFKP